MNKNVFNKTAMSLLAAALMAALAACGGGGGTPSGNNPPAASNTGNAVPLSAAQSYVGTVSFGDTVRIDLDQPAAGQLTLTFLSSQFGLSGSLVGPYSANGTTYTAGTLSAGTGAPAALATAASGIELALQAATDSNHHGIMTGTLQNVPNLKANDGSRLQGQVQASNNGVATVAALAGTYSFVKLSGNYAAGGVPQGSQDAEAGQIKINADGTMRFCSGQPYSDSCANYDQESGTSSPTTGTVAVDPDQTLYPGAFDVTMNGNLLGRAFVSTSNGRNAIFIDQAGTNSDGTFRTGTWALTTTQTLAAGAMDGTWTCTEPGVADNSNQLTGTSQVTTERFAGTQLTPLNADGSVNSARQPVPLFYNQTFDPKASQSQLTLAAAPVNGLIAGEWSGTFQSQAVTGALMFLPLGATQIAYLDEVNANGFFVMGTCTQ
ncbi:hypothetical protein [Paraburkholderia ferrariae]|uniref:hypothetical protein n=1 Tax=Paraburkholderia ferrariae TaxID=386056 RepID=UPI000484653A|nr:hypothetical protein [Paraburkholderia ferrariae]